MIDSIEERIYNDYRKIVERHYPQILFDGAGYGGASFHYNFSKHCRNYKDTPFYYNGELKFVHWTTLPYLSSIINNRELRLYNLQNSEDRDEFNYAGEVLKLDEKQIERLKDNYFIASFCSNENLCNEYLWERYGKNYTGVAITFSLVDNREDWENYFLTNVHYGLNSTFSDFQTEIEALKNRYNNVPTFWTDNWIFAGMFKKTKFVDENEVRLIALNPFRYQEESLRYLRRELKLEENNNRIVSYFPLKLWINPDSHIYQLLKIENPNYGSFNYENKNTPQLKIESIHFGESCLPQTDYYRFRTELRQHFETQLGYRIQMPINLHRKDSKIDDIYY